MSDVPCDIEQDPSLQDYFEPVTSTDAGLLNPTRVGGDYVIDVAVSGGAEQEQWYEGDDEDDDSYDQHSPQGIPMSLQILHGSLLRTYPPWDMSPRHHVMMLDIRARCTT